MFSDEQKREFRRNGFLVLHDAIDAEQIVALRENIWESIPESPDDPSTWEADRSRNVWNELDDPIYGSEINEQVFEYAADLVGRENLLEPDDSLQIALRFPQDGSNIEPSGPQPSDLVGHLDGYGGKYKETGEPGYLTIAGTIYLDRVPPRGGGFTVWPGSHRVAEEFFETHDLEEGDGGLPEKGPENNWTDGQLTDHLDPFEITGNAGTLIIWHGKLTHSAGINVSDHVRMASIARFSRSDGEEIKRNAAANIWKYWEGVSSPRSTQ